MTWVAAAVGVAGIGASLLGASKASKAAKSAADTQAQSIDKATQVQRETAQQARADLQPFRQAGMDQIQPLQDLISQQQTLATDPNAQVSFVKDNPFFNLLAEDSQRRIFQNQAARGKVGSGETAEALQNSLLLLGQDFINNQLNQQQQSISNRAGILNLGQSSAAGQANVTLGTGTNVSNLATQRGDVVAAGKVGSANAVTGGINNLIQTGLGAYQLAQQNRASGDGLQFVDKSIIPARR